MGQSCQAFLVLKYECDACWFLPPAALCSLGFSLVLHTCLFYLEARDLASSSVPSIQQRASSTAGLVDACRAEAGEAGLL